MDAVLLANFLPLTGKKIQIVDLGTGCGVISLLLYHRLGDTISSLLAIERQKNLAELARENFLANHCPMGSRVCHADIRDHKSLAPPECFDIAVCNPPYYPAGSGRRNGNNEEEEARHQLHGGLFEFLEATAYFLKNRASCYYIYPAARLSQFIEEAMALHLMPKTLRFIYNYPEGEADASLALIHCVKNGKISAAIKKPLFIYSKKNGPYSQEMASYYELGQGS